MDPKADLMSGAAAQVALALSSELKKIPQEWAAEQRWGRRLLKIDPLERFVPEKLLAEGMQKLLNEMAPSTNPTVLFMNRAGGGDGAKTASELMPLLGKHWSGASLVYVAFSTPERGVGVLVRSVLVSSAARSGVEALVVAHDRPVDGLDMSRSDIDSIAHSCKLIITYTPGGAAGLGRPECEVRPDPLIERSHLLVQSYPDPESLVGDLPHLSSLSANEPDMESMRLRVQINVDGAFKDLGVTEIGPEGDANERLWVLLENARRHRYRVLIEPGESGESCVCPLVCPCRTVIKEELSVSAAVDRIVPAGSRLIAVGRGRRTLL